MNKTKNISILDKISALVRFDCIGYIYIGRVGSLPRHYSLYIVVDSSDFIDQTIRAKKNKHCKSTFLHSTSNDIMPTKPEQLSAQANRQVRNLNYVPFIEHEGTFNKRLPQPPSRPKTTTGQQHHRWTDGLPAHERLNVHQTLNSSRRFAGFRADAAMIPQDALDRQLRSVYQHNVDLFAGRAECARSPEVDQQWQRRLRNTRDVAPQPPVGLGHPLRLGGVLQQRRGTPDGVRLMCSGHHATATNPGYSRQSGDGNFFNY